MIYSPPADHAEPNRWFNQLPISSSGPVHWLLTGPDRLAKAGNAEELQHERTTREIALNSLEDMYELAPPDENAAALRAVWEERAPFCLYLRAYDFSTRVVGTAEPTIDPPFGEVIAVNPVHAIRLRHLVSEVVGRIPVIGVASPLDPPTSRGEFRFHESEWRARVGELVRAAQLIVMYLRAEESGVAEELSMIHQAGREASAILVFGESDVFDAAQETDADRQIKLTDARWTEKRASRIGIASHGVEGFTHVLVQTDAGFKDAFVEQATALMKAESHREFAAEAPVPTVPLLTASEVDGVVKRGIDALTRARESQSRGQLALAEACFQATWAFFFAVDATRHRAVAALELGRLYLLHMKEPMRAVRRLKESTRLYRRLDVRDMLLTASQELAVACLGVDPPLLDDARRAVEEAESLEPSNSSAWSKFTIAHSREWLERLSGNARAAEEARAAGVRAYGEHRIAGGSTASPPSEIVAHILDEYLKANRPDPRAFILGHPFLKRLPHVRDSLISILDYPGRRDAVLSQTASADVQWELSRLLDIMMDGTEDGG